MIEEIKRAEDLTVQDITRFPIWEYTNQHEHISETIVRPVGTLPVHTLFGRLIGTNVTLANDVRRPAIMENVDLKDAYRTKQFLSISVFANGEWHFLARYFDPAYERHGPARFAASLGLSTDEVFPISYDLRGLCVGDPEVLVGRIEKEPAERLPMDVLVKL